MITPQSPPTLRIEELTVVENEATKLSFTWADLPLDDPRVLLNQNECERFESRPGNSSNILLHGFTLSSGQLHYKMVVASDGVVVREGNLSLEASNLPVSTIRI